MYSLQITTLDLQRSRDRAPSVYNRSDTLPNPEAARSYGDEEHRAYWRIDNDLGSVEYVVSTG